jgi:hypothetical protein
MAVERTSGSSSIIDVLDRVLDKGIVIDAWVRVSLVGIDLLTVEARVVVASIDTYLRFSEAVGSTSIVSRPAVADDDVPLPTPTPLEARLGTALRAPVSTPLPRPRASMHGA